MKQSETKQNEKHIWITTFMIPEWGETFFYCYVDVDIGIDIVQTNSSLINRAKCG